jgi:hypothetical protein
MEADKGRRKGPILVEDARLTDGVRRALGRTPGAAASGVCAGIH